jgi:23S rRNA pseudouridine1911/1915/1917 synthase
MAGVELEVLWEDNHLLVVNKPAGLATMGVSSDRPSVVELAKRYLKERYHKPGNVYVGVVSRLDTVVSGVLVLARTSKAAARLNRQFAGRSVRKTYWAVVWGDVLPESDHWVDWMAKNERRRRMEVVAPGAGARQAQLEYRVLGRSERYQLVEVELITGRKHQIRCQLADHGYPVVGDRKYGSTLRFARGIALHARRLELEHPVRRQPVHFQAPLPASWTPLLRKFES